jgi:DNA polymerase-3 subunit beta
MPVEDYPTLPDMPTAAGTVKSEVFAHAVAQAVTAAGRDDMLPVLTGVRLEIDGSTISLLATDRFRLSIRELEWSPSTPDETLAALVPAKVLADTAKSLTNGSEVTIALSSGGAGEGIIGFEGAAAGGVRRTTTRLLDGEFPKVRSLFPSEHLTKALVDKAALVESVKRVSLVAERNTAVQLKFSDGVLTLDAGSGEEAQASESIEADINGEELTTGFNPQFLLDGLTAIDETTVELAFTQASKPVVISGSGEHEVAGFRYLLMPRRLLS